MIRWLTSNQLKLLAAAFMVCDHVAFFLLPLGVAHDVLRGIGRLSYPMFAYFIAEGCAHTRNHVRYLITMAGCAIIAEIVFAIVNSTGAIKVDYMSIFTTFSIAVLCVYLYEQIKRFAAVDNKIAASGCLVALAVVVIFAYYLDTYLRHIEYGFMGMLMIFVIYILPGKIGKLVGYAAGCLGLVLHSALGALQYFGLCSVPLIALYNGKRGKLRMKYFFYVFYPAHVGLILIIGASTGLL